MKSTLSNIFYVIVIILHLFSVDYGYNPVVPFCDSSLIWTKILFPVFTFFLFWSMLKSASNKVGLWLMFILFLMKPVIANLANAPYENSFVIDFYYAISYILFYMLPFGKESIDCKSDFYLVITTFSGWLICFATIFLLSLKIMIRHNLFERAILFVGNKKD